MAARCDTDPILANEQRLKNQKQLVQQLHVQLKSYNEAFRRFITAEKSFFDALDNMCEANWELKADFTASLKAMQNIAESGARNLETIPVEETIVFRDQFGPYEKEIQDYKDKQKVADAAERKHLAYGKKKNADSDELRKLELAAYEKKTSLGISRRKLADELPTFYKSRMDYYSTFWRSVFQIRADIARAECETLDQLIDSVRHFDVTRSQVDTASLSTGQHVTQGRMAASSSSSAVTSELVATELRDDCQAGLAANGGRIHRVPTFGGDDLAGADRSSNSSRQPLHGAAKQDRYPSNSDEEDKYADYEQ
ncbi:hypothetical protein BOX15_Mlig030716g3 [Macrostomum lignano]|uniref:BAR domain-containing protein n=1 Tax=Macrostomum lignano TaxID=282301 RepID=A0A267H0I4_9PLAT|nr:hypothetical protein BOX15_Mlig030716g3 [Macrostomum lignano]